jgi:6-phosphogluconolactonase
MPFDATLVTLPDPATLADHVAAWLLQASQSTEGIFSVALAGGSTPQALYRVLATAAYRSVFPWGRTHWFWGDERFVPPSDPQSNARMVRQALLAHVPVPAANIHAMPTVGLSVQEACTAYQATLAGAYGAAVLDPARPLFDVTLLGLGSDGHTASLFPGSAALDEQMAWVAPGDGPGGEARITLTYPALNSSRRVAFLVEGAGKRAILARLLAGDGDLPAARVRPVGEVIVFADKGAVG